MGFQINSAAFSGNGMIPTKFSGQGDDVSPPLDWSGEPQGTKSFALIVDDPDAPIGTFVHWVLYRLPPTIHRLPENLERSDAPFDGAKQGRNSFMKIGYGGPMPPTQKPHRYFFKLYALDNMPELDHGANKTDLLKAMEGHVLAQTELMGVYQRQ